ncbi:hypothetical protein LXL04_036146 [Taraxacum kok-saghyz]
MCICFVEIQDRFWKCNGFECHEPIAFGQHQSVLGYHNNLFYVVDPFCVVTRRLQAYSRLPAASQGVNVTIICFINKTWAA